MAFAFETSVCKNCAGIKYRLQHTRTCTHAVITAHNDFHFHLTHKLYYSYNCTVRHIWMLCMHFDRVKCYTKCIIEWIQAYTCKQWITIHKVGNCDEHLTESSCATENWLKSSRCDTFLAEMFSTNTAWCVRAYVTVAGLQAYKVQSSCTHWLHKPIYTLWKYTQQQLTYTYHMCDLAACVPVT